MPHVMEHLDEPALRYARKDFPELRHHFTVRQALDTIREQGVGEKVVYFYVVDEQGRLAGVLPTRRLLASPLDQPLEQVIIQRVVTVPHTATILEVCELFVMHKFLAFPMVDDDRHVLGIVDVSLFTQEVFDIAEREKTGELFETLGFHVAQVRAASPAQAFRLRFPWLLATIASGTLCALLASFFEVTISKALILAFFLTLVLALGESVAIQSMALAVQSLRSARLTVAWFARAFWHEARTAVLLGLGCGGLVTAIICIWRGVQLPAFLIGASILLSLCSACMFGLSVPALLHSLKLDPKIAAGPVTLALTDIFTLLFYFGLAAIVL